MPKETVPEWEARHRQAWDYPRQGFEWAIRNMARSLEMYANAHAKAYETPIAEDYVLGEYWIQAWKGAKALLDGDAGRFDCGAVCSEFHRIATAAGYSETEQERGTLGDE